MNSVEPTIDINDITSENSVANSGLSFTFPPTANQTLLSYTSSPFSVMSATINRYSGGSSSLGSWWYGVEGTTKRRLDGKGEEFNSGGVVGEILKRGKGCVCNRGKKKNLVEKKTLSIPSSPISTSPSPIAIPSMQMIPLPSSSVSSSFYTPLPISPVSLLKITKSSRNVTNYLYPTQLPKLKTFLTVYPGLLFFIFYVIFISIIFV
jgi:hypothetical protein